MIIFSRVDKLRQIDLLITCCQNLLFHGLPPKDQELIMSHMIALKNDPSQLHVTCRFEASETGETRLYISASPIQQMNGKLVT